MASLQYQVILAKEIDVQSLTESIRNMVNKISCGLYLMGDQRLPGVGVAMMQSPVGLGLSGMLNDLYQGSLGDDRGEFAQSLDRAASIPIAEDQQGGLALYSKVAVPSHKQEHFRVALYACHLAILKFKSEGRKDASVEVLKCFNFLVTNLREQGEPAYAHFICEVGLYRCSSALASNKGKSNESQYQQQCDKFEEKRKQLVG
jgi:hypothetical protein